MNAPPPPPPWSTWWYDPSRRAPTSPDVRASDAERAAAADMLSRHYADGRLDDEEFKERLDLAMSAKTRSELSRLSADLPDLAVPGAPSGAPRRHVHPVGAVVVALLIVSAASSVIAAPHVPWLLIAIFTVMLWRRHSRRSFRHTHHHSHSAPPTLR